MLKYKYFWLYVIIWIAADFGGYLLGYFSLKDFLYLSFPIVFFGVTLQGFQSTIISIFEHNPENRLCRWLIYRGFFPYFFTWRVDPFIYVDRDNSPVRSGQITNRIRNLEHFDVKAYTEDEACSIATAMIHYKHVLEDVSIYFYDIVRIN